MNAKELIYDRFIAPLQKPRASYIGIEIEMPVVNLSGEKTEKSVCIDAVRKGNRVISDLRRISLTTKEFATKRYVTIQATFSRLTAPTTILKYPSDVCARFTRRRRDSAIMSALLTEN